MKLLEQYRGFEIFYCGHKKGQTAYEVKRHGNHVKHFSYSCHQSSALIRIRRFIGKLLRVVFEEERDI